MTNFASGKVVRILGLSTGKKKEEKEDSSDLYQDGKRKRLTKPPNAPAGGWPKCICNRRKNKPGKPVVCRFGIDGVINTGKLILHADGKGPLPHPTVYTNPVHKFATQELKDLYVKEKAKKFPKRMALLNPLKLSDGRIFYHFEGTGYKEIRTIPGNPKLQIANDIADNYVALINEAIITKKAWTKKNDAGKMITKLNGKEDPKGFPLIGSGGGWVTKDSTALKDTQTFCLKSDFSWHTIARAFDLGTVTSSICYPVRKKGVVQIDHHDVAFLVTISDESNQTPEKLKSTYAPKYFMRGDSNKSSADGTATFTVWMKTDDTSAPKVTLMVATPKKTPKNHYEFNDKTFTTWTGHAFNFTKLAKKHTFEPIHPWKKWRLGSYTPFKDTYINHNEWHHFQSIKGLTAGSTPLGREILACGYSEKELISRWPENWRYYKNAPWRGKKDGYKNNAWII
jgi:hypothetical protein